MDGWLFFSFQGFRDTTDVAFTSVSGHRYIFSPADPEPIALFSFLNTILNIKVSGSEIIRQQKYFFLSIKSWRIYNILHSITGMKLNASSPILLGRVTCHRAQSTQRSQTYTTVVTVSSWMVGCTSHRMYGTAQQPSEESQVERRAAVLWEESLFCGLFHGSKLYMFQFPLAVCRIVNGQQVTHRLHTMHTCALHAFLPFPSILPTEIQFQQFWWRCLMNPRFCRMGFSITDLYKRYIGKSRVAFLQYLPSKRLTPSQELNRICNLTVK